MRRNAAGGQGRHKALSQDCEFDENRDFFISQSRASGKKYERRPAQSTG